MTKFFKDKFSLSNDVINLEAMEVIKNLKKKGYIVILFSNKCCLTEKKLVLESLVNHTYYSCEIGYTKNDSEAYRYIEKDLKCSHNEILHIGNNLQSDYWNPIKNGWNAVFYGETSKTGVVTISNLMEIFRILELIAKKEQITNC